MAMLQLVQWSGSFTSLSRGRSQHRLAELSDRDGNSS
jgi:hypothetical protein